MKVAPGFSRGLAGLGALLIASAASAAQEAGERPLAEWRALLEGTAVTLPEPEGEVVWRDDLEDAIAEARETDRPLFVTMRCLPCKQCAGFDQAVLEGGQRLDPWLARFVTVRLTDAAELDLGLFPVEGFQDLDLSWWGWFLSGDERIYAVFGGRDHVSDTTRISVPALVNTLRRVLLHHYDPRRRAADVDGPSPDRVPGARTPRDLPGFESWLGRQREESKCIHCHQVGEILRQPALDAGTFDKRRDLQPWPLPENLGLELARDHGLLISALKPGGPAARAGLSEGDVLLVAGERLLFGQADLRGVMQRAPSGDARLRVIARRAEELVEVRLELSAGWKAGVLDWRMSVSQGNVGGEPGFWPLPANARDRERAGVATDAMAVRPFFGKHPTGPAWAAGLRPAHLIVAVDGDAPSLAARPFLVWFRLGHEPGQRVVLTVVEPGGGRAELAYELRD